MGKISINDFINYLPDKVYHGTISKNMNSLKKRIKLDASKECVDFGRGFYTTSKYKQAVSFAKSKTKKYNLRCQKIKAKKNHIEVTHPLIMVYNLDKERLYNLNGYVFEKAGMKWAEFIYNNRLGGKYVKSNFNNLDFKYDYVYGCLADSHIAILIQKVKMGKIKYCEFCDLIHPYDEQNQDQLSFNTNNGLQCLHLVDYKLVKGGNIYG